MGILVQNITRPTRLVMAALRVFVYMLYLFVIIDLKLT